MSTDECVPSEDEMRRAYWLTRMLDHYAAVDAAFDRFLARVRRDAEAAVLREAAGYMNDDQDAQYLVDCARDIEESP